MCATATAIHRAVINSGLKVVERHKHLYSAIHAQDGDDAAVDWDVNWDYKFKNTSKDIITIRTIETDTFVAVYFETLGEKDYNVEIYINGTILNSSKEYEKAYIEDEKVFVPLRNVIEKLNGEISWNDLNKTITIKYNNTEITLKIRRTTYIKNGETFSMEFFPRIENNRTYVPLEFLTEGLGVKVNWGEKEEGKV